MPGELPLVLLALIADEALGGYELLRELERRFAPGYRPSPGSVYPALTALRAEGLVEAVSATGKAKYRRSLAGHQLLAEQADTLRRIEERTNTAIASAASLQEVLARFTARVAGLGDRIDRARVERVLDDALRALTAPEVRSGS
jgi:DNA-binding PadR family transcriptional regulator